MPEWWIEQGIGETRAALIVNGEIVEARVLLEGIVPAGTVLAVRLVDVGAAGRNAIARDGEGREFLLPRTPLGFTEGAAIAIEITREAIPGGAVRERLVETMIAMKRLSAEEIDFYAAHGEWRGKAGGYALQGYGEVYVRQIAGSYSNVVGLPLAETRHLLKSAGYDLA